MITVNDSEILFASLHFLHNFADMQDLVGKADT
jgi:hypothetical protein